MKVEIFGLLIIIGIIAFTRCEKEGPALPSDENIIKWELELVDSIAGSDVGVYNMLTFDIEITDKNRTHVSFYNRTTGVLSYATKLLEKMPVNTGISLPNFNS